MCMYMCASVCFLLTLFLAASLCWMVVGAWPTPGAVPTIRVSECGI